MILTLIGITGIGMSSLLLYASINESGTSYSLKAAIPIFFIAGSTMIALGRLLKKGRTPLVTCRKCDKNYSNNLSICPQCGNNRNKNMHKNAKMAPCRICGTLMQEEKHRYLRASINDRVGRVDIKTGNVIYSHSAWHEHVPCPKCYEPKPLRRLVDAIGGPLSSIWITLPISILAGFTIGHILSSDNSCAGHYGDTGCVITPFASFLIGVAAWFLIWMLLFLASLNKRF